MSAGLVPIDERSLCEFFHTETCVTGSECAFVAPADLWSWSDSSPIQPGYADVTLRHDLQNSGRMG